MLNILSFVWKNEAVRGIKKPEDYFYIKCLGLALKINNIWPLKELGYYESQSISFVLKLINILVALFCFLGGITYTTVHYSSLPFFELGHLYICILMNLVFSFRVLNLYLNQNYRGLVKDFVTKFHLFFYKDNSDYAMKTHKRIHLFSHRLTICLTGQMFFGLSMFNLVPMYNNYAAGSGSNNVTYEHAVYLPYPIDVTTNLKGYIFGNILNWVFSYFCSSWVCMCDLLLSLMVFHTYGHLKILLHKLNSFPRPANTTSMIVGNFKLSYEMFDADELKDIHDKLTDCVDYHRFIVSFVDRISGVFGPMLFVYYMFHLTSGCLLLLECSQMTTAVLFRYAPLTIIVFQQLIQLSVIFEIIGSTSDKLSDAVYGLPWECMDPRNRKMVIFLLMNVQEPVHVKALGVADVGVTSMTAILKTTMSYYTFLRSM